MAVIRDVMPVFELYKRPSIDDAIKLLDKPRRRRAGAGRGLDDSMDWSRIA